jgi:hypothetical protein
MSVEHWWNDRDKGKQGHCPGIEPLQNNVSFISGIILGTLWKDKQCKPYVNTTSLCDLLSGPRKLDRLLKNLIYETFTDVGRC